MNLDKKTEDEILEHRETENAENLLGEQLERAQLSLKIEAESNERLRNFVIEKERELIKRRKENKRLKELLSKKYSTKKLLIFCISATIALGFNLVCWYEFGVYLIHPALATIGLVGTIGFGILSFIISKKEKEGKDE